MNEQQTADELRTLDEAEMEAASGGVKINMGFFGVYDNSDGCVSWTLDIGDYGWITIGQC